MTRIVACRWHPKDAPDSFGDELVDGILKILLIRLVTSLDFFNDLFKIGNSKCGEKRVLLRESDGRQVCFLDGNSSSGIKKYQGSNSSDDGNTRDGVKIVCGVVGVGGEIELASSANQSSWDCQGGNPLSSSGVGFCLGCRVEVKVIDE
ncbi:hypothetical protein Tco_0667856 [Tanacetum coccineum]